MRWFRRLALDLGCVGLSVPVALLMRENFEFSAARFSELIPYTVVCVAIAAIVFSAAQLNRNVWRYTSLSDVLHVLTAVTVVLLLALFATFSLNRLEGVGRSLPVIQWFFVLFAMLGFRGIVRISGERIDRRPPQPADSPQSAEHVLIVGVSDLTELYLRALAAFASHKVSVEGILASQKKLHGARIHPHRVRGSPEDLRKVLNELELHGVLIDRIVIAEPVEKLSSAAQKEILLVERTSAIKVEWLVESLGLRGADASNDPRSSDGQIADVQTTVGTTNGYLLDQGYGLTKRGLDIVAALSLAVVLAPVKGVVGLLVAIDVGLPVVFWQKRPGRHGRPFKLFKFRTMSSAHNAVGDRISDELRSSKIGRFLRRSRLDELPQLYNILLGDMSFVGPRPLLPADQSRWENLRLCTRPGLTGWAQVNGGRGITPEDKAALDIWYMEHASLRLDIQILMRTLFTVLVGERVNNDTLREARGLLQGKKDNGHRQRADATSKEASSSVSGAGQSTWTLVEAPHTLADK